MTVFAEHPALVIAFRRGDRAALETVYWWYVAGVERVVRFGFRLGQRDDGVPLSVPGAERDAVADLVQEVFARAFSERARLAYDGLRPYGPYLLQIARNLLVDRARRSARELPLDDQELERAFEHERDEPADWADAGTMAATQAYLATLSPELRDVHEQRFVFGRSQRDAAAALGISRQQLRTREDKLFDGLRRTLAKR